MTKVKPWLKKKLPKRFKDRWVKALRSGNYKQGTGILFSEHGEFCCLGVAGDMCGIPRTTLVEEPFLDGTLDKIAKEHKVPKVLRMDNSDPQSLTAILSRFNDKGKSFKWIAGYIQKNL